MDEKTIRKYVLQNAVKFNGKANPGAIIGKLIAEDPDIKSKLKELSPKINEIIKQVNKLEVKDQKSELEKSAPELLQQKKVERSREVPELENVKGKVILRFEPSPSGPLHIGHAYVLSLISEIARKYDGKLILRISDTNAENIYPPAYDLIPEDADWVTKNNIDQTMIQSDRLETYYRYMEKLLNEDKAYICTCDPEEYRELIKKQEPCPCRGLETEEQILRWKKMFKDFKKGDAVVRLKTDLNHKNPAMRDFPVFRINDSEHPRTKKKYRVWPLMNLAVAVDDLEMGVTHAIRAKDHQDNALRQKMIYEYLGESEKFPETIFLGRINFLGMPVSCSKTKEAIDNGEYSGWDDIRLPFLVAMRKRGYQPDAFIKYAIDVGISLTDKKVTKEEFFKTINAFNKDVIDQKTYRYFFINDPKLIKIKDAPEQDITLDLHPENKKGGRKFHTTDEFYLTKDDISHLKPKNIYRLMDCLNFKKQDNNLVFDSLEYEKYKESGKFIMHWLPKEPTLPVTVTMEDTSLVKGMGEQTLKSIKENTTVQFERFGFVTLINKASNHFYFLHK